MSANKSTAVMASRREPLESLDFFPTPPFATRALIERILVPRYGSVTECRVWEPAAGEGHMAEILREYFLDTHATDVHDYGRGYGIGSFLEAGLIDSSECPWAPEWIITNPPFNLAQQFVQRALGVATFGVAMLLRTSFIETVERYHFFEKHPLDLMAPFAERVAMTKGQWDPQASSATSYSWFVWLVRPVGGASSLAIIPPGQKRSLSYARDLVRFGDVAQ